MLRLLCGCSPKTDTYLVSIHREDAAITVQMKAENPVQALNKVLEQCHWPVIRMMSFEVQPAVSDGPL